MEPVINSEILSVPPYLSISWDDVLSLRLKKGPEGSQSLIISLKGGEDVAIPNPPSDLLLKTFRIHANHLSSTKKSIEITKEPIKNTTTGNFFEKGLLGIAPPKDGDVRVGLGTLDGITAAMEHNPSQSDMPSLPNDLLDKVAAVSKALTKEGELPKPEYVENCNCVHCQIARAVEVGVGLSEDQPEEAVSEEDLKFREWDINQKDEHLYKVSNPLNSEEIYSVYIGDPLGCTCGKKDCEHIRAVLSS